MTYEEAQQVIKENWDEVEDITPKVKPARDFVGFLIAPQTLHSDEKLRNRLMNDVITKGEDNAMVLAEYAPHSYTLGQLYCFVVVRLGGNLTALKLEGYLEGAKISLASGNAS